MFSDAFRRCDPAERRARAAQLVKTLHPEESLAMAIGFAVLGYRLLESSPLTPPAQLEAARADLERIEGEILAAIAAAGVPSPASGPAGKGGVH